MPKPRDQKERPPCVSATILEARANEMEMRKTEKDLENENGGAGVYSMNLSKNYILANDEWKEDTLPEILDGHNVHDFIDLDILHRDEELEREDGIREAGEEDGDFEIDGNELTPQQQEVLALIRKKKSLLIQQHRMKKRIAESRPIIPRKFDKDKKFTTERLGRQLSSLGLDLILAIKRMCNTSTSRGGRKRERSADGREDGMDIEKVVNCGCGCYDCGRCDLNCGCCYEK